MPANGTADPSTTLRSGRDDKVEGGSVHPSVVVVEVSAALPLVIPSVAEGSAVLPRTPRHRSFQTTRVLRQSAFAFHEGLFSRHVAGDAEDHQLERSAARVGKGLLLVQAYRDGVSAVDLGRLGADSHAAFARHYVVNLRH